MTQRTKSRLRLALAAVTLLALLVLELGKDSIFVSPMYGEWLYIISTRLLGGLACLMIALYAGYSRLLSPKIKPRHILLGLPCLAVAINNFPIIPFFTGDVTVGGTPLKIATYALSCFAVGFFEEMAFRGCIFPSVLQRIGHRRAGVFWSIAVSSAVFGVIHLLNLFAGASPLSVLLQIGYSFLIGAMCATVLVRTGNIWYCVIIHGVYNFAGGIVPELGYGNAWTTPEIILTVAVALPVAAYVIYLVATTKYTDGGKDADVQGC